MAEHPAAGITRRRARLRVEGTVQGVGFRPYVYGLARELELAGFVGNDARGVFVEAEGDAAQIDELIVRLPREAPVLAVVEHVDVRELEPLGDTEFVIATSVPGGERAVRISPDVATCADCLAELSDPSDRRYGFAFINCTACGPRYTIVTDVPYDRPATTMAAFDMCAACAGEYHDPADRRFHAQPTCCPACGPTLVLTAAHGAVLARARGDAAAVVAGAAALLRDGAVLAIKGLGGYHLAVDATHEGAAAALRARKHREDKPFAVMVADLAAAERLCQVSPAEAALLHSPARPIVLLERRDDPAADTVTAAVAPRNRSLGLLLPYTPLHHLLAAELAAPFVLTSGNLSDEPIAYRDADATKRLGRVADAFLTHDRAIHIRVDDSVTRLLARRPTPLRRARGLVPGTITLPVPAARPLLAVGAELKSTVCLARGASAVVSQHLGDLEHHAAFSAFEEAIEHLCRLFDAAPEVVAHDLHPEYLSTKHAVDTPGVELVGVQHHHAHIASCLADHGRVGPVIGVAFDGTGYGPDGTVWGGEFLVADLLSYRRVGHLVQVPLPGGAAAIREPWRMAAVHLARLPAPAVPRDLAVAARNRDRWGPVLAMAAGGLNSPLTSSAGRLFDAVAALLGVRDRITYEGQAAIELEQLADPAVRDGYAPTLSDDAVFVVDGLVAGVVADLRAGVDGRVIAGRFHAAVAAAVLAACERVRAVEGLETVALSGGVFQNAVLVERCVSLLEGAGFEVLTHRQVPPNDGGISLGQAAVAAARLA